MGEGPAPPMAGDGPAVRGSSVQGFPCRYYDRRVLDEHFERGLGSEGVPQGKPDVPRPPKRNGRDEKSPDGRSSDRTITTPKTRFDDRPSSQPFNGQTQMRAWQGETTPGSLTLYPLASAYVDKKIRTPRRPDLKVCLPDSCTSKALPPYQPADGGRPKVPRHPLQNYLKTFTYY